MAKAKEPKETKDSEVSVRKDATEEQIRVNLLRFIDESGYSATSVADLSGIPQATIHRYMHGVNAVSLSALEPLARVFGRKPGDFFEREPPPPPKNLIETEPVLLRSRPGVKLTPEDFDDFDAFVTRVAERQRGKKVPPKK